MTQAEIQTDAPSNPQPTQAAPPRRNRALRLVLGIIAVVAVFTIAVYLIFQQMRASRSQPLEFTLFRGAAIVEKTESTYTDRAVYSINAPLREVVNFYVQAYGTDSERGCILLPSAEQVEEARCIVDNSQDNITQRLLMSITYSAEMGRTLLTVERDWGN